jgi:hypothetical protein
MTDCIQLPHKTAEYACPINGLEDQYEAKTGQRLPGYFVMDLSMLGFMYLRAKLAPTPRMVFWGSGTGKAIHEFLADVVGYRWQMSEGLAFKRAWQIALDSLAQGRPVILGLLDMYHLPYFSKFYHRVHIPQHYVLLVGFDPLQDLAYVQDNSRPDIQAVPLEDLKQAWNVYNPGQGVKNTLFMLDFNDQPADLEHIARVGLKKRAACFLHPKTGFMGLAGLHKLAKDFANWERELTPEGLRASLTFLVTFNCSAVPLLPQRLLPYPLEHHDPHQAVRDRFAAQLRELSGQFGVAAWAEAAAHFEASGQHQQRLTELVCDYLQGESQSLQPIPELLQSITRCEEQAFRALE